MKKGLVLVIVLGAIASLVALGPRVHFEEEWMEPTPPTSAEGADSAYAARLDRFVEAGEAAVRGIRRGDEKAIVWHDAEKPARTPLSLVYLHGFSADRHEVEPLIGSVADSLGANAFFARLRGHGRGAEAMGGVTVEEWLHDVAAAFAIGAAIGQRVVLVGTSTGGTLATWAAARSEVEGRLAALVLLSPNYHPVDRSARILLWPWGSAIARVVIGAERCFIPVSREHQRHWTTCYPTSALLPMMALVERVRTMDLSGVDVPTLALYVPDDRVVDAAETEAVLARMPRGFVEAVPYADTEDPDRHIVAGDVLSPGTTEEVAGMLVAFLRPVGPSRTRTW